MMQRGSVLLVALVLAGCANPLGLFAGGDVSAALTGDAVILTNTREDVVFYAAIGDHSLILFAPCVREDCLRMGPRESVRIPLDEVPAGRESSTVRVHWWLARGSGADAEPGTVHTIRLRR